MVSYILQVKKNLKETLIFALHVKQPHCIYLILIQS